MFSILNPPPILAKLIPSGYTDIHSHILPGIDDGAKDVFQSLQLIDEMKKMGFNKLIATPHIMTGVWDNSIQDIKGSYDSLKDKLDTIHQDLSFASEYLIDSSFLEKIQTQKLICLKQNYVLVELSYLQPPLNLFEIIFELQVNGYVPVLAHPERYTYFFNDFKNFKKLKNSGCLFQLNLMSVVGHYGIHTSRMADRLLRENMIDYVGSDIHHIGHINVFKRPVRIKSLKALEFAIEANKFFKV